MCGRLALASDPARIARALDAQLSPTVADEIRPSWNVAPTRTIAGVRDRLSESGERVRSLEAFHWGFVPSWATDLRFARKTFNARAESAARSKVFRHAFGHRRLLVPVDAFYEWRKTEVGAKQPYAFRRSDAAPLVLAGLWEPWRPAPTSPWLLGATILTISAGPDMAPVHDRQPVVLDPGSWDLWTDPAVEAEELLDAVLVPSAPGVLVADPVGVEVGDVRNDGPGLLDPLADPAAAG